MVIDCLIWLAAFSYLFFDVQYVRHYLLCLLIVFTVPLHSLPKQPNLKWLVASQYSMDNVCACSIKIFDSWRRRSLYHNSIHCVYACWFKIFEQWLAMVIWNITLLAPVLVLSNIPLIARHCSLSQNIPCVIMVRVVPKYWIHCACAHYMKIFDLWRACLLYQNIRLMVPVSAVCKYSINGGHQVLLKYSIDDVATCHKIFVWWRRYLSHNICLITAPLVS